MNYIIKHNIKNFEDLRINIDITSAVKSQRTKSYPNLSNCCKAVLEQKKYCSDCNKEIPDMKELTLKQFKIGKEEYQISINHLEEIKKQLDTDEITITEFRKREEIDITLYSDRQFNLKQVKKHEREYTEYIEILNTNKIIAIGKITYKEMDYPIMLYPFQNFLRIMLLHTTNELYEDPVITDAPIDKELVSIYSQLIEKNKDEFDISKYDSVRLQKEEELIEQIINGKQLPEIESKIEINISDNAVKDRLKALLEEKKKSVGIEG